MVTYDLHKNKITFCERILIWSKSNGCDILNAQIKL